MEQNETLGEPIAAVVRCRPMNKREIENQSENCVYLDTNKNIVYLASIDNTTSPSQTRAFSYDKAVDSKGTTKEIYDDIVKPIVDAALEGINGAIFAYGQTGSGKKFTMRGYTEEDISGIVSLSADTIFDYIYNQSNKDYMIKVANFELYNEKLKELGYSNNKDLKINDAIKYGKILENPQSSSEIVDYYKDCYTNSLLRATHMGMSSSRAHNILIISIESFKNVGDQYLIYSSYLSFVVLAGSERVRRTNATGSMLQEARMINISLTSICNVIASLCDKNKYKFIPYRDSKLTYLLSHALGGNCNTVFIGTINPTSYSCDETLSTLRYMNRVKACTNYPIQNINNKLSLLVQIDKIYQSILNSEDIKEEISLNINSSTEDTQLFQSPKETIRHLIDYFHSTTHIKSVKIYGPLAPFNSGSSLLIEEFVSLLQSLSSSFIKLVPLSPRELFPLITDFSITIHFIDYQLRYMNSFIKNCLTNKDNDCEDFQKKHQKYEEKVNDFKTSLLVRSDTDEWKSKANHIILEISKIFSDLNDDQEKFNILKQLKYLSI